MELCSSSPSSGPRTSVCFSPAARFTHWGEREFDGRVDERGEVALLSRSILIEGEVSTVPAPSFPVSNRGSVVQGPQVDAHHDQQYGGHLMVQRGGALRIEGVELRNMAQATVIGRCVP